MLNNTPMNNIKESTKRKIIYIIIGIICLISVILAIVFQILQLAMSKKIEVADEIIEFNTIFDNKLNEQGYTLKSIKKIVDNKDFVFTKYDGSEKVDDKYDIDIKIPTINIDNEKAISINNEIEDIFSQKARNIIRNEEDYEIIYTVEYTAYINSNILSLVIKSNLKEGSNAQRVIIKAYTYNITSNELIDINEIVSIKQLNKSNVQKEINDVVVQNAKQAKNLIDLGYKVYERNLSDEMYKIENVDNFFLGPNGILYIIYAYGNNSYTSELDIIPIK